MSEFNTLSKTNVKRILSASIRKYSVSRWLGSISDYQATLAQNKLDFQTFGLFTRVALSFQTPRAKQIAVNRTDLDQRESQRYIRSNSTRVEHRDSPALFVEQLKGKLHYYS